MKVGDLVKIREYNEDDIFIILRESDKYAIRVFIIQSNKTGIRFKMAAEALLPLEGVA